MNLNKLQELLAFYDKNLKGPADMSTFKDLGGAFSTMGRANGESRAGLGWAMANMGGDGPDSSMFLARPDFFGGGAERGRHPDYVRPEYTLKESPFLPKLMESFNTPDVANHGEVSNYLSKMLMGARQ